MTTVKFTGTLILATDAQTMPGTSRIMQRLRFKVDPMPDSLGRIMESVNYYDVFIYGADEIKIAWIGYNPEYPAPPASVTAQLVGRLRLDENTSVYYNNLTLRLKKIAWNYDNN